MRIIVIGMGETGTHLTRVLTGEQHDVTIVDKSPKAISKAQETMDVMALEGHGASLRTLEEAQAAKTDLAISVTNDDEVNILSAVTAKRLGARRVVARVSSADFLDVTDQGRYQDLFGIDLVICEQSITAQEIQRLVKTYGAISVEMFLDNRIEMIQLGLRPGLPILDRPIRDLPLPKDSMLAGVYRTGELIIPTAIDTLLAGDEVFLLVTPDSSFQLEKTFGKTGARRVQKVTIVGGGEVGLQVTRLMLEEDIEVVLIDQDPQRCGELSRSLDSVAVINGDGTNLALLQEERVQSSEVFVAVSGDDDANLMSTLLAKHLGVRRTVCLVSRPDYVPIYEALGVDATVSPRLSIANRILKYVRHGQVVSTTQFEDGKLEILEIVPAEGSPAADRRLRNLNLPQGAIVGALAGLTGIAIPPKGDEVIHAGDRVIVFCRREVRSAVERLFRKRFLSLD